MHARPRRCAGGSASGHLSWRSVLGRSGGSNACVVRLAARDIDPSLRSASKVSEAPLRKVQKICTCRDGKQRHSHAHLPLPSRSSAGMATTRRCRRTGRTAPTGRTPRSRGERELGFRTLEAPPELSAHVDPIRDHIIKSGTPGYVLRTLRGVWYRECSHRNLQKVERAPLRAEM